MGELCDTFGVSFLYFTLPIVRNESKHFLFYGVGGTGGRGGNKTVYQVDQFSPALGDNHVAMIFMIFVGLIGTYIILFDGYKAQIGEFNTAVAESTLTQIEERLSSVMTVSTQQFGKVLALLQEACGLMPFITYSTGAAINETSASNEWVWTGSKHVYQRRSANWTVNRTRERDVYELMHIAGTLMGTFNVFLGSYDGGPEEAYEKSTDLVIPLTQRVECTSPPASTWCKKLFRENQNMSPEKKAKGPAGYFGVWDIVSALDKAQDAILASPLPYSENQARYFVVNEKGIMLMSNMPPGTNGINIASMAYNIDVTSQGGRPPPVYISDVKSSEDSFVSRLIEDIGVRYPNRDTDEDKLQAVSKDLEEGALTAKGRGWGRWKNEMRMGFNTDGDTQLDVYTALQKSASKTKYFPMEGDSSNWIVFGVISTDLRDSSPSFNRRRRGRL
eukprot:g2889.t1